MANGFGSMYIGASGLQSAQNALNTTAGIPSAIVWIKISYNWQYKKVLAIRRIF